jgi:methyl-accepting chemotaxis protein
MNWFANLGFRWKITLPLLFIGAVYLVSVTWGLKLQNNMQERADVLTSRYLQQISLFLEADRDLYQALQSERDAVFNEMTAEHKNEQASNLEQAKERALKAIALFPDNNAKHREDFLAAWQAWKTSSDKVLAMRATRPAGDPDVVALSYGQSIADFKTVRSMIDDISSSLSDEANALTREMQAKVDSDQKIQVAQLIASIIIILLFVLLVPPMIVRPLKQINSRIREIADGDGDLRPRIRLQQKDELGQLANSFDSFMDKLQGIVGNIMQCTDEVGAAANHVNNSAVSNRSIMDDQKGSILQVVSAVEEMSVAIKEVARNTNHTAERARSADEVGGRSLSRIQEAIATIQSLSQQLNESASLIEALKSQAANANSVLDVIRGVAEQTNLLALNAAIEAARAGEQGRGFAVVADEVRTLASRTQDSTADIQRTLQELQNGVNQAVQSITASVDTAEKTVASAGRAGDGLGEISAAVGEITNMATQIATAVEEQSVVIEDINKNLTHIGEMSHASSDGALETTKTSERLKELSHVLNSNVNLFKVN